MSFRADMRAALRSAVLDTFGDTWQYRRLTSGTSALPRTYSAYADVEVHATSTNEVQVYDENGRAHRRREAMRARLSDLVGPLKNGDQLKDPDGIVWAIDGVLSGAQRVAGTVAYSISRDLQTKAEPNRNGGV